MLLRTKVLNAGKKVVSTSLALNTIDLLSLLSISQTKVLKVHFLLMERGQDFAYSNPGSCEVFGLVPKV